MACGKHVRIRLAPSEEIDKAIKKYYGVGAEAIEKMIEDGRYEVSDTEARVTVTGMDGRSAERTMPLGDDGALGSIHGPMLPMAVEELPTRDGGREYTVSMFSRKRSGMAWVRDGVAYRTIHDHGGFRLCFDLEGSSLL